MLYAAIAAVLATMALALARGLLGPTAYDRVLAVNMFGTKTVLMFALVALAVRRSEFLDLALAYALLNFIGVLAVLEFVHRDERRKHSKPGQP